MTSNNNLHPGELIITIALPRPLNVEKGGVILRLSSGPFPAEIHFKTESDSSECSCVAVKPFISGPWTWIGTAAHEPFPIPICNNIPVNIVTDIIPSLAWLIELASLEAGSPYVYDDFIRNLKDINISISGIDSDGIELIDYDIDSSMRPIICHNSYSHLPGANYQFPSPLSKRALSTIAYNTGPHWEYWHIGYYVSLRAMLRYGNRRRLIREAVTSFQTALETAMIAVKKWSEDKQYSNHTIPQFPECLQYELYSLLLTRNLMLHRGEIKRKELRNNETWKNARMRLSSDADGDLTDAHLIKYAETCFDALLFIESSNTIIRSD